MSDLSLPPLPYQDAEPHDRERIREARERIMIKKIDKCLAILKLAEVDHRTAQAQRDAAFKVIRRIVKAENFEEVREILEQSGWLCDE